MIVSNYPEHGRSHCDWLKIPYGPNCNTVGEHAAGQVNLRVSCLLVAVLVLECGRSST